MVYLCVGMILNAAVRDNFKDAVVASRDAAGSLRAPSLASRGFQRSKAAYTANVASRLAAGALRAPSLASLGSQRSKTASRLSPGDTGPGSLTLQRRDAPLARFMRSTASASMDRAGRDADFTRLTRVDDASRESAGPGSLCRASSFAALIASRLAAGPDHALHSTPRCVIVASTLPAGAEVALDLQAGVVSKDSAGTHFDNYRDQSDFNSVHDSDTRMISEGASRFSADMQSRASK